MVRNILSVALLLVIIIFTVLIGNGHAQVIYSTCNDGISIANIDPSTATGSVIGNMGNTAMGLAIDDYDGKMYTIVDSCLAGCDYQAQQLALVDPISGQTTKVGQPFTNWIAINAAIPALEVGFDGYIYAGGVDGSFYRINKTTGEPVLISTQSIMMVMDYAFDKNGTLWAVAGTKNDIYNIDIATGVPTFVKKLIGISTIGSGVMGIMFDKNDVMYATNMAESPDAHLYRVDIGTGIAADLGVLNLSLPHGGDIYSPIDTCVASPSGLIAWWPGEGDSYDMTGANNGTLMNGATFAAGKVGQGFNLDGIDDYVDAGTSETFNFNDGTGDFTIGAWINLAEYPGGSSRIVSKGSQDPYNGWSFQVDSNGALGFLGNGVWELTSTPGAISVGNWAYVAVTKNGNTSRLYKDGIEIASAVYGDLQSSVDPLTIGSGFKGLIDEIVIFNRALSASDISFIFNAGAGGICKPTSDLEISGLTAPSTGIPGSAVIVNDTARNSGSGTAGASTTRYYWSANNVYDSGDVLLGSRSIPSLGAGATSTGSTSVTIPSGAATGAYYIIARADADGAVAETNETNNTASVSINIGDTRPDFTSGTNLASSTSATSGSTITFGVATRNAGAFTAAASTTRVYLSTNATLDAGDVELGSVAVPSLAPTKFYLTNISVTIPPGTASGTYYIITKADADGIIAETNETNNGKSYAITVTQ